MHAIERAARAQPPPRRLRLRFASLTITMTNVSPDLEDVLLGLEPTLTRIAGRHGRTKQEHVAAIREAARR